MVYWVYPMNIGDLPKFLIWLGHGDSNNDDPVNLGVHPVLSQT